VKQARALRQSNKTKDLSSFHPQDLRTPMGKRSHHSSSFFPSRRNETRPAFWHGVKQCRFIRLVLCSGAEAYYRRESCVYIRGGRMLFREADSQERYARLMMRVKGKVTRSSGQPRSPAKSCRRILQPGGADTEPPRNPSALRRNAGSLTGIFPGPSLRLFQQQGWDPVNQETGSC
jgi:hypothetical protein